MKMIRGKRLFAAIALAALGAACATERSEPETRLVLAGQALIKKDPRLRWDDPYGSLRPILEQADVAFTNFEMAVLAEGDRCGIPTDYEVSLGAPRLAPEVRPGNTGGPHAVAPEVMGFLSDLGFNLMSLSNNHAWDLGDCGVIATREAAEAYHVTHAVVPQWDLISAKLTRFDLEKSGEHSKKANVASLVLAETNVSLQYQIRSRVWFTQLWRR